MLGIQSEYYIKERATRVYAEEEWYFQNRVRSDMVLKDDVLKIVVERYTYVRVYLCIKL